MFVDQQRKFRALVEGSKNMSLPTTTDAAAVKKFQADYEALRKKVRFRLGRLEAAEQDAGGAGRGGAGEP